MNSYPFYDLFDESYAKLNAVIETVNERHECFVSEMMECDLLHETNPSLSSPTLEISLYDDYQSSLPLELDFMVRVLSTSLEEVIDPAMISIPIVASSLSSTPNDITICDLNLLASPLPLAQCTGLEIGESSKGDVSFVKNDLLD